MKNLILLLVALLLVLFANAQIVNIPDANFKAALLADTLINTNQDGEIQLSEAAAYTGGIIVNDKNITDLAGIEAFTATTFLFCEWNNLTSLDLSNNTALTSLACGRNQLTTLNVSNNTFLTVLRCVYNQLSTLDVSNNTSLTELLCSMNQLSLLDVSNNTALISLYCHTNQLTSLDVSNNTALISLICHTNQLTLLDISNNTALTSLSCTSNQLTTLDVINHTALTVLWCGINQLTSLDISNNTALTSLKCNNNQLTSLDISNNTALTELWSYINPLTSLDVSNNTALEILHCYSNQLSSLDLNNNTTLTYLHCSSNPLNSIDVSNLYYLEVFWCSNTQLTTIDVSNNLFLEDFSCDNNDIDILDISNNSFLHKLRCNNNNLINLDVSNNTAIVDLYCYNNQLTALNLSNLSNLTLLACHDNQITNLDLSYNTSLNFLWCNNNYLNSLSIKNTNNINFIDFNAVNNLNLYCIEVDDPVWSFANWTDIDAQTSFGSNCLYGIADPNEITGKVVIDTNCVIDGTEQALEGIIVKTNPEFFYGITDSLGAYTISTDTGTYQVEQLIPTINGLLINPLCPNPNYYTVYFDSLSQDTSDLNFYNEGIACPLLTIDINSDRRRRCFTSNTYVHYCNDGFVDEDSVEVHVQLPDYVIFVSANYPYTIDTLGNYVFDIGNLAQGDCGDIHIMDSVACINGITGLTQCTEAWITPPNDCANSLDTAAYNAWDKSSVMVEGECIGDTIVRFIITNTGDFGMGDMQVPSEYRIYEDNALVYTGSFQLLGQEQLVIDIPANGHTYRLEADQHPMHPGNSHPNETIENCGNPYTGSGFVNTMPQDDEDAEIEIDCMEIIDSYDPNDKSVSPQGITANNYIMPGTSLDYVIRFQNTGSDTAFTVVVVDTLSEYLDISTFQAGISSHPYTLDVSGHGNLVLLFQFFNINLPDSTTNEANSHGFVKFKIAPYDTLANGTVVQNTADIYFDYNIPVITNTSQVIISDTVIHGNPLVIHDIKKETQVTDIRIFPNPTTGKITVRAEGILGIEVMDITGKNLQGFQNLEGLDEIDLSQNPKGIYIIKVTTNNGVGIKKIVKQ